MAHTASTRSGAGRIVQTEMSGSVPAPRGPRGSRSHPSPGGIATVIRDAASAGVRAPRSTPVMRENRVPKVRMGLGQR